MKALQVTSYDSTPSIQEVPKPEPRDSQVRLRILATGINFADTLLMTGTYQEKPDLPFTLGMEVCGVVDKVGDSVKDWKPGDRVVSFHSHGGLAEYGCFHAAFCAPAPESMPPEHAAGFLIAYGTSHLALARRSGLKAGERLLVLGASGGVGQTAIEIGKAMGAEVIAAANGGKKVEAAKQAGADHLIDTSSEDIKERTRALGGADVVYDAVGGAQFDSALRACNPEGRILTIGYASGKIPQIPASILLVKNISVIGVYFGGYPKVMPEVIKGSLGTLFQWQREGKIKPKPPTLYPLDQAAEAVLSLRDRKSVGKVVVRMPES